MPSMYRYTDGYRWYSEGNERPSGLVSYEVDDQGRVIIAAGGLSSADDQKTAVFYSGLHKLSQCTKVTLVTPRKAKAIVEDRELHNCPLHGDGTAAVVKLEQ